MRNPRSSKSVSAIQRFAAELCGDWCFDFIMAYPRGSPHNAGHLRQRRQIEGSYKTKAGSSPAASVRIEIQSDALSAEDFINIDALRGEGLAQHRNAVIRLGGTAHEDVERRVTRFWPRMDRDMALRQHGDP